MHRIEADPRGTHYLHEAALSSPPQTPEPRHIYISWPQGCEFCKNTYFTMSHSQRADHGCTPPSYVNGHTLSFRSEMTHKLHPDEDISRLISSMLINELSPGPLAPCCHTKRSILNSVTCFELSTDLMKPPPPLPAAQHWFNSYCSTFKLRGCKY